MQGGINMEYVENPYKVQNIFAPIDHYRLKSLGEFWEGMYYGSIYK